jgi:hypothetical protein
MQRGWKTTVLLIKLIGRLGTIGGYLGLMFLWPWLFYALPMPLPDILRSSTAQAIRRLVVDPTSLPMTLPDVGTLFTSLCYEASIAWLVVGGIVLWAVGCGLCLAPFCLEKK